jgi:hypothetical protein
MSVNSHALNKRLIPIRDVLPTVLTRRAFFHCHLIAMNLYG